MSEQIEGNVYDVRRDDDAGELERLIGENIENDGS